LVDTSVHLANYQAPVLASQPMMHQQQLDGFQTQALMAAHQLMVQQPPPIAQQSWLGGCSHNCWMNNLGPGVQSSQLSSQPQQSEIYWSQESASQQEVYQPEAENIQPQFIPPESTIMAHQSVLAQSQLAIDHQVESAIKQEMVKI
jgi:hypothetical protein